MAEKEVDGHSLDIDMTALHLEWVRQPQLYHQAAVDLANARHEVDRLKGLLDLAEANADAMIRDSPSEFGLTKTTDKSVEMAVLRHPGYKRAQKELLEAKHELGILTAYVEALEHKKRALESLVQLALADYFSAPKAPKGEARDKMDEAKTDAVRRRGQYKPEKKE